ncbi:MULTISPECIES: hypothetical protein [unclassified Colwellia]|nr:MULTISPECIES: hypothetical protein [unclassified Colwellia]MBA6233193.1 hypothetical protein [Colwellia sp. MB02u-7]MBA6236283.1 hypothetical protein [Colwellia sp. MB02u-11]MBA6256821.1 hypothetical protein [Colwellia sp. MB3u-28]MBA6261173.1 hypothetical protein [Colwellia sp. MB3u-41]MBA6298317.1 hypothetical protein [Colwellia sp. MB3u-22]
MLTESNIEAVKRRCQFELGIDVLEVTIAIISLFIKELLVIDLLYLGC